MPELPEVETIKKDLEKHVVGHRIIDVWLDWDRQLKPSPETFKKAVTRKEITGVSRRAKLIILKLSDGQPRQGEVQAGSFLLIHLKLTGRLLFKNQDSPADKFTHILLKFDRGKELRLADMRKFGWMRALKDEGELDEILKEFGIEPFTNDFTFENFKKAISPKKTSIKIVIMDQKNIAGVGNIYADESLWCAKTHPLRKANSLSESELKKLYKCIIEALEIGIKDRGTSVDMYVDLLGEKGKHAENLNIFRKEGQPCPRCSSTIKKIRVGGRGTHFCPRCQILL